MHRILFPAIAGFILAACGSSDSAPDEAAKVSELKAANEECREMIGRGDIESANPFCLKTLEEAAEYDDSGHEYADAIANAAWLFYMRSQDEDSEQLYERALELQQEHVDSHPRSLARTHAGYGMLLTQNRRTDAGMKHLEKAEELLIGADAQDSEAMAALLGDMAETFEVAGKRKKAIEFHQESVAVYRNALGPAHANVGVALNNLGTALQFQDNFDAAEEVLQEAVKILEAALGVEHPASDMARSNLRDNEQLRADFAARRGMAED